MAETRTIDVKQCARCEGEHPQLVFSKFSRPYQAEVHEVSAPWGFALCPTNQEPILLEVRENEEIFTLSGPTDVKRFKLQTKDSSLEEFSLPCPKCKKLLNVFGDYLSYPVLGEAFYQYAEVCDDCYPAKDVKPVTLETKLTAILTVRLVENHDLTKTNTPPRK